MAIKIFILTLPIEIRRCTSFPSISSELVTLIEAQGCFVAGIIGLIGSNSISITTVYSYLRNNLKEKAKIKEKGEISGSPVASCSYQLLDVFWNWKLYLHLELALKK